MAAFVFRSTKDGGNNLLTKSLSERLYSQAGEFHHLYFLYLFYIFPFRDPSFRVYLMSTSTAVWFQSPTSLKKIGQSKVVRIFSFAFKFTVYLLIFHLFL